MDSESAAPIVHFLDMGRRRVMIDNVEYIQSWRRPKSVEKLEARKVYMASYRMQRRQENEVYRKLLMKLASAHDPQKTVSFSS